MSILDFDATKLAARIRSGETTSLQATDAYIERLQAHNPSVRCLVEERFADARQEAIACDDELRSGSEPKGRLFGVPISMKEAFDVAGMRTTGGLMRRRNAIADQDAEAVAKLKQEGAIILGKTNTPTLCFCQETDNRLYGITNNPWDLDRTVGGSSGGEGALIALGGAAVGFGSDIGGSLRFPAHFNGVVSFKSGNRQVTEEGTYPPIYEDLQMRMLGIGAVSKSVRDAKLINEIVAHSKPESRSLSEYQITLPIDTLGYPISYATQSTLKDIKDELEHEGISATDEQPPMYREAALLWQLAMSIDGASNIKEAAVYGCDSFHPVKEWLKELFGRRSDWHRYLTWAIIGADLFKPSGKKLAEMQTQFRDGDAAVTDYLANRLLILPVYHTPARKHGEVYAELFSPRKTYLKYMPYIAYANTWGLPALTVPVAEDRGLPIGIQIVGRIGSEDAIFQLGAMLEARFRGWKRANPELSRV